MPKNALFLLKNRKNCRTLGALPPDPLGSGDWGLSPQPPVIGGSHPDPHWPPVAGDSASKPQELTPNDKIFVMHLLVTHEFA